MIPVRENSEVGIIYPDFMVISMGFDQQECGFDGFDGDFSWCNREIPWGCHRCLPGIWWEDANGTKGCSSKLQLKSSSGCSPNLGERFNLYPDEDQKMGILNQIFSFTHPFFVAIEKIRKLWLKLNCGSSINMILSRQNLFGGPFCALWCFRLWDLYGCLGFPTFLEQTTQVRW